MTKSGNDILVKCEYLQNPLGIQNKSPRFSWRVDSAWINTIQNSYQINVKDKEGNLVWDSGKIESSQCSAVEYGGEALHSGSEYEWDVTLGLKKCEDAAEEIVMLSGSGYFEMGLLAQEDWKGSWLCAPEVPAGASPLIRKTFFLNEVPAKARIYICGLGYCEMFVNGYRLGDAYLDPAWTDYPKTVRYRVFDILPYLQEGENVLALELGDGWFGNDCPAFIDLVAKQLPWLDKPRFICNIHLDEIVIASCEDGSWYYSDGPIVFNNIYDGETYDATKEKAGYRKCGYSFNQDIWKPCCVCNKEIGKLRSQIMPPIGIAGRYEPEKVYYIGEKNDYTMVADFGKNRSGFVEITANGKKGQKITMRYAEVLNSGGSINQKNLRTAKACDTYIFGDNEKIVWHPHFTYHGFRYVEIAMEEGVTVEALYALELHNKVESAGGFCCSNSVLNQIQDAIRLTEVNNLHSVPTDCPQRDERLGWMNDMTVRFEEGLFNYDLILLYEKWLQDICDGQAENGAIPDTAPYFFGNRPADHISSIFILLPWYLYLFYGDKQIMRSYYDNMIRYFEFKMDQRDKDGILPERYIGDWAPPMKYALLGYGENAVPNNVTQGLLTTSYLYYDAVILAKISEVLNKKKEADYFRDVAEKIRSDINRKFLNINEGGYGKLSQGDNTFPLFLQIVPEQNRETVLETLVHDIKKRDNHITTGNQMTKYLFELLDSEKMPQLAFELAVSVTYPSLGYMLAEGATSIWERWENLTINHMNSHSHPMLGAYTVWFYKGLAGLRDFDPETRSIVIRPSIIPELESVEGSHMYPWGECKVSYQKKEKGILLKIEIPWNTTGIIDLSCCQVPYCRIIYNGTVLDENQLGQLVFQTGTYCFELEAI